MAGTDRTRPLIREPAPTVVLVRSQMGENIGMAARAMLNFGLTEMRVVAPNDDHQGLRAVRAASGADQILREATVFATTEEAIADANFVVATTARRRDMVKPVYTPHAAAPVLRARIAAGQRVCILFGPERTGLENDEIALADAAIEAPLNPAYSSLNLSQAVLLVAYEWFQAGIAVEPERMLLQGSRPATKDELHGFFHHLETELDNCGFLRIKEKRPSMVRNLRNLFHRAAMTEQEVRTMHGVVKELRWGRRPDRYTADGIDRSRAALRDDDDTGEDTGEDS